MHLYVPTFFCLLCLCHLFVNEGVHKYDISNLAVCDESLKVEYSEFTDAFSVISFCSDRCLYLY